MASSAVPSILGKRDGTATWRSTKPQQRRAKRHPNGGRAKPATASPSHRNANREGGHSCLPPRHVVGGRWHMAPAEGGHSCLPRRQPCPIPFGTAAQPPRQQPPEDHDPVHRAINSPTWDNSCSQISYSVRRIQSHTHACGRPPAGASVGPPKTRCCKLLQWSLREQAKRLPPKANDTLTPTIMTVASGKRNWRRPV
jgi:hypothetical protein